MKLVFKPLDESNARLIVNWSYEAPYDFYNMDKTVHEKNIQYLSDPENGCYAILSDREQFIGYCSFGKDGQVPGGNYDEEALDIGIGIAPEFAGQGNGTRYFKQVMDFGRIKFNTPKLRVTIASFNKRAQRMCASLNFGMTQEFLRAFDGKPFIVMEYSEPD